VSSLAPTANRRQFDVLRWTSSRFRSKLKRFHRAWRYATGALSEDDAQTVMLDCREPAGWHPLLILTVEDTLDQALETYADHPALRDMIAAACSRVGHKWEEYGDAIHEARRWAIEVAEDYARQDNIVLLRWDDILPPHADAAPDPVTLNE
jgi:hypothetical protein